MDHKHETPVQPKLEEMFAHFLERQTSAGGLASSHAAEVVPFEAAPVQAVDARLAWDEARRAAALFFQSGDMKTLKAPPDWAQLVAAHEPITAPAFALGNFPQMVRDLHTLAQDRPLSQMRAVNVRPTTIAGLEGWVDETLANKQFPQALLAVATLRLAKQFAAAEERLKELGAKVPAAWRAVYENEVAALAWHQGQTDDAAKLWQKQPDSAPVLFNRGLAALFSDHPEKARPWLNKALTQLPDDSGWQHLARLYLALAEMKR